MEVKELEKIEKLREIINNSKSITLFTGAGISVPSGIPDFRSASGIFNSKSKTDTSPEEIISKTYFFKNTKLFYEYYRKHLIFKDALPNLAHKYFSKLEKEGKLKAVVTQNIDNLHQAAGSKNVLELHGSVHRNNCIDCNKFYGLYHIVNSDDIPFCEDCGGIIKPDVVLYEESLDEKVLSDAINNIQNSDTLIIVGTSLVVYPAAGLVRYFRGNNIVLINKQKTSYDDYANLVFNEDVVEVIKKLEK